jgi:hypothetical protein
MSPWTVLILAAIACFCIIVFSATWTAPWP